MYFLQLYRHFLCFWNLSWLYYTCGDWVGGRELDDDAWGCVSRGTEGLSGNMTYSWDNCVITPVNCCCIRWSVWSRSRIASLDSPSNWINCSSVNWSYTSVGKSSEFRNLSLIVKENEPPFKGMRGVNVTGCRLAASSREDCEAEVENRGFKGLTN